MGIFSAATVTNAVAVYLLHDVDADLSGRWNQAYLDLSLEFVAFAFVTAALFLFFTWIGKLAFRFRSPTLNTKLGFALGIAVILIQYPAELAVRKVTPAYSEAFLLGYILLSPIVCAATILLDIRKRPALPRQMPQA